MTTWDERAAAEAERRDRHDSDWCALHADELFRQGAAWQRDQLLTDETHPRTITKDEFEALCLTVADQIPPGACRAEVLAYTATYALRAAGIEVSDDEHLG